MITAKANCTSFNLNVQHFFLISAYYFLTGWGEEPDKQQARKSCYNTFDDTLLHSNEGRHEGL